MSWSTYQEAIFREVAEGRGHVVVIARAGSGKTTTIVEALGRVPEGKTVLMAAFNKSIATELAKRAPKGVEVKTLHAHGFAACRRAFPGVKVDEDKTRNLCKATWGDPKAAPFSYSAIVRLVAIAKDTLTDPGDHKGLDALVDAFDLDVPDDVHKRQAFVVAASQILSLSAERTDFIDFGDMCWLPVFKNLSVWAFDRVFVDETQDLCPTQIELLLKCVRRDGRVCAVGDDRQAIYGFRGADAGAVPKLIERLRAKVLPLSISYRCARTIVELAKKTVPDFEAAPSAREGIIFPAATYDDLRTKAAPGDMVVSRSNAPLIGLCLGFFKEGKRAAIKGRNVGEGLIRMIQKSGSATIPELLLWVEAWHEREVTRLVNLERPTEEADDKRECLLALTDGAGSIAEVVARAESLFSQTDDASRIMLGTTHRLKGLEAERVWVLADTFKRRYGEEGNLWYVAITRAKSELMLARKAIEGSP